MKLSKRILTFCILFLIVMFVNGVLALYKIYPSGRLGKNMNNNNPKMNLLHNESSLSHSSTVNLLLLGLDEDGFRADVIILANFNPDNSSLNLLSVARDTKVFARGKFSKINSLYSAGKERLIADAIRDLTGLPVHYYVTMKFKGFREIIDVLDGVYFDVPFHMKYDDPDQSLHIHLEKGPQLLDGSKSEQLVRYRKGNRKGDGYTEGDIGRIEMHQEFIKAFIKQKLKVKYFNRADEIFAILANYMRTNFVINDFVKYIPSMKLINDESIKAFILPGESIIEGNAWFYIVDNEKTEELIKSNFDQ